MISAARNKKPAFHMTGFSLRTTGSAERRFNRLSLYSSMTESVKKIVIGFAVEPVLSLEKAVCMRDGTGSRSRVECAATETGLSAFAVFPGNGTVVDPSKKRHVLVQSEKREKSPVSNVAELTIRSAAVLSMSKEQPVKRHSPDYWRNLAA